MKYRDGVSIVICCHNGEKLLPQTLKHIAGQDIKDKIEWEVILIDNASTDDTSNIAREHWPREAPAPFRIIYEQKLGLANARERAFSEAKYEFVSFIDDDIWIAPEWVETVFDIMTAHPDVGICGGFSEAVYEIDPPEWFEKCKDIYAIGPQGIAAGDVTDSRGYLWGSGGAIRKSAFQELADKGFEFTLSGRQGTRLSSGEDAELCLALRLAGWRLWYDPRLRFGHFFTAKKLRWEYSCRIVRGYGAHEVSLIPYKYFLNSGTVLFDKLWIFKIVLASAKLFLHNITFLLSLTTAGREGNMAGLRVENAAGYFVELLRKRKLYAQNFEAIRQLTHQL